MEHVTVTVVLLLGAVAILFAELYIPSGGILFLMALIMLAGFVFRMFSYSEFLGYSSLVGCIVGLPSGIALVLRNLEHLPMSHRIIPPNPPAHAGGAREAHPELAALVDRCGTAVTPLRPVGMCEFDGARVPCVAESGSIESGERVVARRVHMNELVVRPQAARSTVDQQEGAGRIG